MYSSQSLIALALSQYHLEHPYFHKFKNGKIQEKTSLPNLFYLLLVIQVSCFFRNMDLNTILHHFKSDLQA